MAGKSKKTNPARRFSGRGPRPDNTPHKRKEATGEGGRQEAWDALTAAQKLAALDVRLGAGVGAKKQRAKLAKLMEVKNGKTETKSE